MNSSAFTVSAEAVASAAQAGRQGYGGFPPRIYPRVYTHGFLRRRVKPKEPELEMVRQAV
jgi:hypothetical protein